MKQFMISFGIASMIVSCTLSTSTAQAAQQPVPSDSIQSSNASDENDIRWYTMFANIPRDWERWYDISFRKERLNEWYIIGGLTLATYFTDDLTYTPAAKFYKSSTTVKTMSDFCANMGEGTTQFAVAGALGAYGLVFKDQKALRTGSQIVQTVLASGAVIQVLNMLPAVKVRLCGPHQPEFGKFCRIKSIIIAEYRNSTRIHPDISVRLLLPSLWLQKITRM